MWCQCWWKASVNYRTAIITNKHIASVAIHVLYECPEVKFFQNDAWHIVSPKQTVYIWTSKPIHKKWGGIHENIAPFVHQMHLDRYLLYYTSAISDNFLYFLTQSTWVISVFMWICIISKRQYHSDCVYIWFELVKALFFLCFSILYLLIRIGGKKDTTNVSRISCRSASVFSRGIR